MLQTKKWKIKNKNLSDELQTNKNPFESFDCYNLTEFNSKTNKSENTRRTAQAKETIDTHLSKFKIFDKSLEDLLNENESIVLQIKRDSVFEIHTKFIIFLIY